MMQRTLQTLLVAFVAFRLVSSTPIEAPANEVILNVGDDGNVTVSGISPRQICGANDWQINYYWDGGCSDYAGEADIGRKDGILTYNYYLAGTWSNNVVKCPGQNSQCALFSGTNGGGNYLGTAYCGNGSNNCVNNNGAGVRSMKCSSDC